MKKRIFVVIFVFFLVFQNENLDAKNTEKLEEAKLLTENTTIKKTISKVKFTKQELKKEIKKRKKYHKVLLEKYNKDFDEKYFNLISENSLILTNLRKELKS